MWVRTQGISLQYLLLFSHCWGCFGNLLVPREDSYIEKHLSEFIHNIVTTFSEKDKPLVLVTPRTLYPSQMKTIQYDMLAQILHNESQFAIMSFGFNNNITKEINIKPYTQVIMYPPIEMNKKIAEEILWKIASYKNAKGQYIIVSTSLYNNFQDRVAVSQFLIQSVFKLEVVNIIALVPHQTENKSLLNVDVFTWNPNEQTNICSGVIDKVTLIGTWNLLNKILLQKKNIFPKFPKINMKECILYVKSTLQFPFITQDKKGRVMGSFFNILRIIHEDMRFRVRLGMDVQGEHLAFPFVYSPVWKSNECSLTYSYFRQDVTWYVPPGLEFPRWQSLIRPLSPIVWTLMLIIFVLGSYAIRLLGNYESGENGTSTAILTALQTYLGSEATDSFKGPLAVSFFSIWLFYCLIINTAYQSALFGLLVNPGEMPPVKTFEELEESGLIMKKAITFSSGKKSGMPNNSYWLRFIKYDGCTADRCYRNLTRYRNLAVVDTSARGRLHMKFNLDRQGKRQIYSLEENVATAHIGVFVRRLSCVLYKQLEATLQRANSAGLINKWDEDVILNWKYDNPQFLEDRMEGAFSFTLWHLQGTFYLLLIGLLVALVEFILETFIYALRS